MCFFIAEGFQHTSNFRRYLGRLLLAALLSHVPYTLCFNFHPLRVWTATSIMWSLFLGLLTLALWQRTQHPEPPSFGHRGLCAARLFGELELHRRALDPHLRAFSETGRAGGGLPFRPYPFCFSCNTFCTARSPRCGFARSSCSRSRSPAVQRRARPQKPGAPVGLLPVLSRAFHHPIYSADSFHRTLNERGGVFMPSRTSQKKKRAPAGASPVRASRRAVYAALALAALCVGLLAGFGIGRATAPAESSPCRRGRNQRHCGARRHGGARHFRKARRS